MPIMTSAVVLPLTRLTTILLSNLEIHLPPDSSHDPFEAQHKAHVYPPLLYGA